MIPLSWYLIFAALLFCIGLYGVLSPEKCHRHPDGNRINA